MIAPAAFLLTVVSTPIDCQVGKDLIRAARPEMVVKAWACERI